MANTVRVILLCEDMQQMSFAFQFARGWGIDTRYWRVKKNQKDRGAGHQDVQKRFPKELVEYRKRSNFSNTARLIAIMDQDAKRTINAFSDECLKANVSNRDAIEKVVLIVPARNIENWLRYIIDGTIDEVTKYPKSTGHESRYAPRIRDFARGCKSTPKQNRPAYPTSLAAACEEFETRFL